MLARVKLQRQNRRRHSDLAGGEGYAVCPLATALDIYATLSLKNHYSLVIFDLDL